MFLIFLKASHLMLSTFVFAFVLSYLNNFSNNSMLLQLCFVLMAATLQMLCLLALEHLDRHLFETHK
jgi:hypothetical protein